MGMHSETCQVQKRVLAYCRGSVTKDCSKWAQYGTAFCFVHICLRFHQFIFCLNKTYQNSSNKTLQNESE